MRTLLFAAALLFSSQAHAESPDMQSANFMMLGCETYLRTAGQDRVPAEEYSIIGGGGFCIVQELIGGSDGLVAGNAFCHPRNDVFDQGIRVVVSYTRNIPQRTHEAFVHLALEALQKAWPCRR